MSGAAALQGLGFGAFEQAAWSVPWSAGTQRLVEAMSSGARGRCAQSEYDREQECCSEGVVFLMVVESVVATVAYVCLCSELVGAGRRVEYYAAQAGRQAGRAQASESAQGMDGWMDRGIAQSRVFVRRGLRMCRCLCQSLTLGYFSIYTIIIFHLLSQSLDLLALSHTTHTSLTLALNHPTPMAREAFAGLALADKHKHKHADLGLPGLAVRCAREQNHKTNPARLV
jgi:hypothetical protein